MSSGAKRLQINPSERALSSDINRLQAFQGADSSEERRVLSNTSVGADDLDAGGLYVPFTTQQNPAAAEVLGGLLVQPQIGVGNLNLLITPGVARVLDPDAIPNTDDSPLKRIIDRNGVQTIGALVMTANASGSTRIDVIECSRITSVIEIDSRDIFDPVSGLFTAASVNKVITDVMSYRVRLGTPGAGFPGTALGWCPLAVASVPNTATTNDVITFWDVRPLVSDRIHAPTRKGQARNRTRDITMSCDAQRHTPAAILTGQCDVTGVDGTAFPNVVAGLYRLGGVVRRGTPGADSPFGIDGVDLNDAGNHSTTFAAAAVNYVYLLEPFGLSRWARYTDASTGARQPRSPRGILVVTSIQPGFPSDGTSSPLSPVPLPASTGFTGQSTAQGACIACWQPSAGVPGNSFSVDRGVHTNGSFNQASTAAVITNTGGGTYTAVWSLAGGTVVPDNAIAVYVTLNLTILVPMAPGAGNPFTATPSIDLDLLGGGALVLGIAFGVSEKFTLQNGSTGGAVAFSVSLARVRVPLAPGPTSLRAFVTLTGATSVLAPTNMFVLGWES
jgi:hypothetical protein